MNNENMKLYDVEEQGAVPAALDSLDHAICHLAETIKRLYTEMSPVLKITEVNCAETPRTNDGHSLMANRINDYVERVRDAA